MCPCSSSLLLSQGLPMLCYHPHLTSGDQNDLAVITWLKAGLGSLLYKAGTEWIWNHSRAAYWVLIRALWRQLWAGSRHTSSNFCHTVNIKPAVSILILCFCYLFFIRVRLHGYMRKGSNIKPLLFKILIQILSHLYWMIWLRPLCGLSESFSGP